MNESLDPPKSPLVRGTKSLREADGFSIDALGWSADGEYLAAAEHGKIIHIWNAKTQTIESSLELLGSSVLSLDWNAKGDRWMASGNRVVKCWDVEN